MRAGCVSISSKELMRVSVLSPLISHLPLCELLSPPLSQYSDRTKLSLRSQADRQFDMTAIHAAVQVHTAYTPYSIHDCEAVVINLSGLVPRAAKRQATHGPRPGGPGPRPAHDPQGAAPVSRSRTAVAPHPLPTYTSLFHRHLLRCSSLYTLTLHTRGPWAPPCPRPKVRHLYL